MMTDELFHMDPLPDEPGRPISELAAIHRDGLPLLQSVSKSTDPESVIWRVRSADDLALDATRRYQVTIRVATPGGKAASEWDRLWNAQILHVVYGFLGRGPDRITDFVVIDALRLCEDLRERPSCQVRVPNTRGFLHHAPGGASFIAIDVRRLRPETIQSSTFHIDHDPAPIAVQEGMF